MKVRIALILYTFLISSQISPLNGISVEEDLTLTLEEKAALDKFKFILEQDKVLTQDYMREDIYLIKWLRLGKLDLRKSVEFLKAHLAWRAENKLDTILDEHFGQLSEIFPIYLEGEDYEGKPVLAAEAGQWDVRSGVISGLRDDTTRYVLKAIEIQCKKIREKQNMGQNVTRMRVIIDLKGYNLVQHGCPYCISIYVNFIRNFIYQYPYMTDSLIFVNTPPIFEVIVEALNLRRARATTVKIFGYDRNQWQKYLFDIIPKNQLPKFLGGTKDTYE